MKKWFKIYLRKYIRSPKFLLSIILLLSIAAVYINMDSGDSTMRVGIVNESNGEYSEGLIENLTESDSLFEFTRVDDLNSLRSGLESGDYIIGYKIKDSLDAKFEKGNFNNLIEVYAPDNSLMVNLTNEILYAQLFRQYSFDYMTKMLLDYDENIFYNTSVDQLEIKYDKYIDSDYTYKFQGAPEKINRSFYSRIIPIDKVFSFIVFVMGSLSLLEVYEFRKTQLALNSSKGQRFVMENYIVACYVLTTGVLGLCIEALILPSGIDLNRILVFANYSISILLLINVYGSVFRRAENYVVYLPVIIIASLLIPNVIVDVERYFSGLGIFRYLFGPHYFILFSNLGLVGNLLAFMLLSILIGFAYKTLSLGINRIVSNYVSESEKNI